MNGTSHIGTSVAGCKIISTGDDELHAMRMAARFRHWAITHIRRNRIKWWRSRVERDRFICTSLRWKYPSLAKARRFSSIHADLFQDGVRMNSFIHVWDVMARAHWHIFQVSKQSGQKNMRRLDC